MSLVYNGNDGVGPGFWFGKSRGTSLGSNTLINNGDQCGGLFFHAADGTDKYSRVGSIVCYTDGTTGANSTPGKIEFSTTSDGAVFKYGGGSQLYSQSDSLDILNHGDVLIFDGHSQMKSTHAVPDMIGAGERINLTFRTGI